VILLQSETESLHIRKQFAYKIQNLHENQASVSLKVQSLDTFISFGVTNRLEVSAVIPLSRVGMGFHNGCSPSDSTDSVNNAGTRYCYDIDKSMPITIYGAASNPFYNVFSFQQASYTANASDIGDVTLRGKYELLKKSDQGLALGLEYRLPTGDPLNILGSGAMGIRPFVAWGYNSRVSPHANIGYQYNGSSVNDVRDQGTTAAFNSSNWSYAYTYTNTPLAGKLPNIVTFSGGADNALTRRLNLDADLLERMFSNDGSSVFQSSLPYATSTGATAQFPVTNTGFTGAK